MLVSKQITSCVKRRIGEYGIWRMCLHWAETERRQKLCMQRQKWASGAQIEILQRPVENQWRMGNAPQGKKPDDKSEKGNTIIPEWE